MNKSPNDLISNLHTFSNKISFYTELIRYNNLLIFFFKSKIIYHNVAFFCGAKNLHLSYHCSVLLIWPFMPFTDRLSYFNDSKKKLKMWGNYSTFCPCVPSVSIITETRLWTCTLAHSKNSVTVSVRAGRVRFRWIQWEEESARRHRDCLWSELIF